MSLRWHGEVVVSAVLVALMTLTVRPPIAHAADTLGTLSSVLEELRQGGLVIYFRHGATDQSGPSEENADLARCETQRNLSAEGRAQVTGIGNAFRALRIPVGTVTSSPFCRTRDTAKLAFGNFTVSNDLYFAIAISEDETKRFSEVLRRMLSTPPAKGTNAVIVAHTANLREATGIWPKPEGVAFIFRPLPQGRFETIAMVLPGDWAQLAARKSAPKSR